MLKCSPLPSPVLNPGERRNPWLHLSSPLSLSVSGSEKMCFGAATMATASNNTEMNKPSTMSKTFTQFQLSPRNNGSAAKCVVKEGVKYELVDYDSLPEFLKHNEFILSYYRSEWPLKQTLLSIFSIHNETICIWTHLIGFFIFLMLAGHAASVFPATASNSSPPINYSNAFMIPPTLFLDRFYRANLTRESPSSSSPQHLLVPRWPFYLYLTGVMFCLLMSSAYHLLTCHSSATNYVMLRLDFAGISGIIVSTFYPLVYYTFACDPFFRNLYLSSITISGLTAVLISLMPTFDSPQFRSVRAVLFGGMAASMMVPIAHKMVVFGHHPEAVLTTRYEAVVGIFYALGGLVYTARVPERWLPGKFDLAGHSHQLFHALVVAGAYTNYLASLVYLGWREAGGC